MATFAAGSRGEGLGSKVEGLGSKIEGLGSKVEGCREQGTEGLYRAA